MEHSHSHSHEHHHTPSSFNAAFALAILLNLAFTAGEATYAFLGNSMSLLADAAHNFGDVFGLVLSWGASWLLTLPPKKRYSYGYKRTTILASLTNALILVTTSALIAYESIRKLIWVPVHVNESVVIIVALVGIFINCGSALLFRRGAKEDLNIHGAFLHLMLDGCIAVAVVITGILIFFTKKFWLDPVVGLLIVGIILWGTKGLLQNSIRLLLDAVPHHIDDGAIEHFLKNIPGVTAIHDFHVWGLSTKEIALTVHLIMPDTTLTDADYQKINLTLKEKFRVDHATIQIEKGCIEHACDRTTLC